MKTALQRAGMVAFCFCAATALAAIPSRQPATKPTKVLQGRGLVMGGQAGTGFSLTKVTLTKMSGRERLVLDIGDLNGRPMRGFPGYYHVELQKNPQRLVIDLAQTPNVFFDEKQINARLKDSKILKSSQLLLDPTDQTLSLVLDLKKDAKAQVYQVAGKKGTSRVVVDLL